MAKKERWYYKSNYNWWLSFGFAFTHLLQQNSIPWNLLHLLESPGAQCTPLLRSKPNKTNPVSAEDYSNFNLLRQALYCILQIAVNATTNADYGFCNPNKALLSNKFRTNVAVSCQRGFGCFMKMQGHTLLLVPKIWLNILMFSITHLTVQTLLQATSTFFGT